MNSLSSKVILKKLNRINNVSKHAKILIINISKGETEIRPVYKVPDKLTIINVFDEIIKILFILNINFVVSNTAKRGGQIGILITIKTHIKNGDNKTKTRAPD
jgi:hypothetical protein